MKKDNVVPLRNLIAEAHNRFREYTQSVAFHMTLSRGMIQILGLIRDFGSTQCEISLDGHHRTEAYKNAINDRAISPHSLGHSVPIMWRLAARGLIWHDDPGGMHKPGHWYHKLTPAGEKMCELLVLAGLLAPPIQQKKQRTAK